VRQEKQASGVESRSNVHYFSVSSGDENFGPFASVLLPFMCWSVLVIMA
jgi:hypothetical protein